MTFKVVVAGNSQSRKNITSLLLGNVSFQSMRLRVLLSGNEAPCFGTDIPGACKTHHHIC